MSFIFRRIYFIKKDFQTRFILRFVVSATAWAILTVFLFVVMAERRLEEIRYSTHIMVKTTADILLPSALTIQSITLLVFAIMVLYAVQSLWANLAGPLYSLKKDIWRIAEGDLASSVSLREEDEFHDLAEDVDKMRGGLRHRWARIKERQEVLTTVSTDLSKSIAKGQPSIALVSQLRETVERMKEEINVFQY